MALTAFAEVEPEVEDALDQLRIRDPDRIRRHGKVLFAVEVGIGVALQQVQATVVGRISRIPE